MIDRTSAYRIVEYLGTSFIWKKGAAHSKKFGEQALIFAGVIRNVDETGKVGVFSLNKEMAHRQLDIRKGCAR